MSAFPGNKTFALTFLDDTDDATLENVKPLYDLLRDLGMRTTKTAWPMTCPEVDSQYFKAETLQNPDYLAFTKDLIDDGFELASHCATMESSRRDRTMKGLDFLAKEFDCDLNLHCNHGQNLENIYWGLDRYRILPLRVVVKIFRRFKKTTKFLGHIEGSEYFWGDICRNQFKYVRNFAFNKLDISDIHSGHPYRLKSTPYVNYWFSTANAPDVHGFNRLVNKASVDALVQNGGHTIISTHFGKGFVHEGRIDEQVKDTLIYISEQSGWFVPVSTLLDNLLEGVESPDLTAIEQYHLELAQILDRVKEKIVRKLKKIH